MIFWDYNLEITEFGNLHDLLTVNVTFHVLCFYALICN